MIVDNESVTSATPINSGNGEESPKKGKFRDNKKVCPHVGHHHSFTPCGSLSQVPEKRPEVRFLEVSEIPGITIGSRFQKVLSAKKQKTDHLNSSGSCLFIHSFLLCSSQFIAGSIEGPLVSEASLLPQEALDNIASSAASDLSIDPSMQALQANVADLEQEIRDLDFRLHFMYRQRQSTLALLNTAKSRAEKYNL